MVENKDLDAVIIASANSAHYEQTVAAAQAELHVYVEKPMAITNKEAWEMVRVCRENKVKLTIGTNQRFWLEHEWAKELTKDGVIGQVKFGRSSLLIEGGGGVLAKRMPGTPKVLKRIRTMRDRQDKE